ncbi:hypothetical protein MTO96_028379 [Rhipicephalus appendiculatus]
MAERPIQSSHYPRQRVGPEEPNGQWGRFIDGPVWRGSICELRRTARFLRRLQQLSGHEGTPFSALGDGLRGDGWRGIYSLCRCTLPVAKFAQDMFKAASASALASSTVYASHIWRWSAEGSAQRDPASRVPGIVAAGEVGPAALDMADGLFVLR